MPRFFTQDITETGGCITGEDAKHIAKVLRMKVGDELTVCDTKGRDYDCMIEEIGAGEVRLKVLSVAPSHSEPDVRVHLYQAMPKADKMETIIQKAVELGAYEIIPVEMKRCVVRLDGKKAEKKTARWQQIAESAAKQSKRMLVPRVHPVLSYKEALAYAGQLDVLLIPYELAGGMDETKKIIGNIKGGQSLGIFIGPEGGFEEEEVEQAVSGAGAQVITLGKRILRTETAGLTVLSVLMFALEE